MQHLKKIVFILSVALNLLLLTYIAKRVFVNRNSGLSYYLDRDELFETLHTDSSSIVFIGTSLTQNFELAELLGNCNVKNRGINGDITEGVINRIPSILKSKPQKIFIEIGINDLGTGVKREHVAENYKTLIRRIQDISPGTKIYAQSLFPTQVEGGRYPTYCNKKVNDDIVFLNNELRKLTSLYKITFIDTYSGFVSDGQLNPIYSVDGIHLNGAGYKLWAKILAPYISEPV
ncbi:MAG: hypothetical protein POELPBGB_00114 [Bacteroidia bacterium]|nr:hypothetical protein [Bacteroidia bacterium]